MADLPGPSLPGEFSVFQFFEDASYEKVREGVDAESAAKAAAFYTSNVAARAGITRRVIVTDGGDYCVFEWKAGVGVVFPTPEMRAAIAQLPPES